LLVARIFYGKVQNVIMPEKTTTKRSATLHTPEQQDYRGHCLFNRQTGQKKERYIRDQKPGQSLVPFHEQRQMH
jgi:hypothetical protein